MTGNTLPHLLYIQLHQPLHPQQSRLGEHQQLLRKYIIYDLTGNIKTYTRRGQIPDLSFIVIDNLTYTYGDAARPDRLTNVSDAGNAVKGFKFTAGAAAYAYDLNGNLTQDNHKSLTLAYNYLNLPNFIVDPGGAEITLTYTADGEKLTKLSPAGTQNYLSGIEYFGNALDAIYHSEGRCTPNGATAFHYEYTIKDHLGNARINFRANGAAVTFLQELHYYPFGMLMEGIGTAKVTNNGYKYNGKELNEDLGLNWLDYGMRWYDAALGRFWGIDPIASDFSHVTPYNYAENRVPNGIDLWGLQFITMHEYAQENERTKELTYEQKQEVAEANLDALLFVADLVAGEVIPGYDEVQSLAKGDVGGALLGAIPGGGLVKKIANKVDEIKDLSKAGDKIGDAKKTFQTYTKDPKDPIDGVYSGKTSGTKSPQKNVADRDKNHHMNETHGPAKLDKSSSNSDAIRGREQKLIDGNGGAKKQGGTSGNTNRGVAEKNKNAQKYDNAAKKEFGN